jgi:hypothetical protein
MERLQGSLQRKAGQEARMLAAAAETQARKQESRATLVGLQPKVGGSGVELCSRRLQYLRATHTAGWQTGAHIDMPCSASGTEAAHS